MTMYTEEHFERAKATLCNMVAELERLHGFYVAHLPESETGYPHTVSGRVGDFTVKSNGKVCLCTRGRVVVRKFGASESSCSELLQDYNPEDPEAKTRFVENVLDYMEVWNQTKSEFEAQFEADVKEAIETETRIKARIQEARLKANLAFDTFKV